MIKKLWQYLLATRPTEASMMVGFPLIGLLIGLRDWESAGLLVFKFFIATYPLVTYVYCLNSLGGLEHDRHNARLRDNPVVSGKISLTELKWLIYGGAFFSGLLYFLWFPSCVVLWLLIMGNWTLYSHPRIYAKARPYAGTILHFTGGILQFMLGYVVVRSWDLSGILIAVYFALTFAAGHLNHEVKDHDADKEADLRTNAIVFGPERVFSFAFNMFTFAFAYLLTLSVGGVLSWRYSLPYLVVYPFHYYLHRQATTGEWSGYDKKYQMQYRFLFVFAGVFLVLLKWRALAP